MLVLEPWAMLDVTREDLVAIVRSAFDDAFELKLDETLPRVGAPAAVSSSLVALTGGWNGAVILDCSPALATDLAASMFAISTAAVARHHVVETLLALASMIAEDLEVRLDQPCSRSAPTSLEFRDTEAPLPGTLLVHELCFEVPTRSASGQLRLVVAERDPQCAFVDQRAA